MSLLTLRTLSRLTARGAAAAAALAILGCPDFHQTGPEDPSPLPRPTTVEISVQYTQPGGCISQAVSCEDVVVFFGSWMRAGGEIQLAPDASHHVWTGRARGVPVNFPPTGGPYEVRVYDPFLQDGGEVRFTGQRLSVGSQLLTGLRKPGAHDEAALVFVDANGLGHNPF
jgi:hypothetical protein